MPILPHLAPSCKWGQRFDKAPFYGIRALTLLENWLLVAAGQAGYQRTFIGQLIYDLLYYDFPNWVFTITYLSLAGLTALTLVLIPPVWRKAAPTAIQ